MAAHTSLIVVRLLSSPSASLMTGSIARRTRLSAAVNSSTFELLKDAIVVYLLVTRSLKVFRHLRARGITQTAVDLWQWLSQVSSLTTGNLHEQCHYIVRPRTICALPRY